MGSPALAPVLAALVAVVNTRFPPVAALLVVRIVAQLKEGYAVQDRELCVATAKFIACLYNHGVVGDLLVLECLSTFLLNHSDGSVELAAGMMTECAPFLSERCPTASENVFQRLRDILHDGQLGKRAQVLIEGLMRRRRNRFQGEDILEPKFDLVLDEDITTHMVYLEEDTNKLDLQLACNEFQFDEDYLENERIYDQIRKDILGAEYSLRPSEPPGSSVENDAGDPNTGKYQGDSGEKGEAAATVEIPKDMTEGELGDFRRTIYLTLNSGIRHDEWAHKLLQLMRTNKGKELELCNMIVRCCSHSKTFDRTFGLLGRRLCQVNRIYILRFEETFATHYATIHSFEFRQIRNIASFYAFLLASDNALPWNVLQVVQLIESETTASSRIFLTVLFQEMAKTLGHVRLTERFADPKQSTNLKGIFLTNTAEQASFIINFFAVIGLGFLTENLREQLKTLPNEAQAAAADSDSSSLSSSSVSSSSLSSSSLSPSSGEENGNAEVQGIGSKRVNEQTSPPHDGPPSKVQRHSSSQRDARDSEGGSRYDGDESRRKRWDEGDRQNSASFCGKPGRDERDLPPSRSGSHQRSSDEEGDRVRKIRGRTYPADDRDYPISTGRRERHRVQEPRSDGDHDSHRRLSSRSRREWRGREERSNRESHSPGRRAGEKSGSRYRNQDGPSRRYYSDREYSSDNSAGSDSSRSYEGSGRYRDNRSRPGPDNSDSRPRRGETRRGSPAYSHSPRRRRKDSRRHSPHGRSAEPQSYHYRSSSRPKSRSPSRSRYRRTSRARSHSVSSYSSGEDGYCRHGSRSDRRYKDDRQILKPRSVIQKRYRHNSVNSVR